MFRRYTVFFDGAEVVGLKEGESFRVETVAGDHELYAKIDWAQTPPAKLTLTPDEVAKFVVRPGGTTTKGLGQAINDPSSYLVLERL